MGEVNPNGDIAEDYCNFVMDLASGLPVDDSLIVDGRKFNSRGGKDIGRLVFLYVVICFSGLAPTDPLLFHS